MLLFLLSTEHRINSSAKKDLVLESGVKLAFPFPKYFRVYRDLQSILNRETWQVCWGKCHLMLTVSDVDMKFVQLVSCHHFVFHVIGLKLV